MNAARATGQQVRESTLAFDGRAVLSERVQAGLVNDAVFVITRENLAIRCGPAIRAVLVLIFTEN
ncbi:hypothetical protein M2305_000096 [Gluconobacter cerinus]|uniref:hypothetical protein n=1 Tax=Gluconobacter cerinus TaxID=38307 RepID=UPI002227DD31|nr:hypothetical protein [Gluconobacter cerinus]MCW2264149.1 hypothetical protein [Gluconobacter cerinus]